MGTAGVAADGAPDADVAGGAVSVVAVGADVACGSGTGAAFVAVDKPGGFGCGWVAGLS